MPYRVEIAAAALRDAEEYRIFIRSRSHDDLPAEKWWDGLMTAIDSLAAVPARCALIPEQNRFSVRLHHLIYASHRIIFRVDPKVVRVVRVYHSALRPLTDLRQRPRHTKPAPNLLK